MLIAHVFEAIWRTRIDSFPRNYLLISGLAAIVVAWIVGPVHAPAPDEAENGKIKPRRASRPVSAIIALGVVALILIGYVAVVLKWEAFADYDDDVFTLFTLRGRDFYPPIWPTTGRFFPLGQQEFNLIRHFTSSVAGYHAVPICQLLILCCLLAFLDDALPIAARLAQAAILLLLSSIVISFTGLVFSERNVVFWLICLVFFVARYERTRNAAWAVAAALSAQAMLYYKETAFLLLVGFAAGRLLLRCRRQDGDGWDFRRLRARESRLDWCLIALVAAFLLYYASVMSLHPSFGYADAYSVPWTQAVLYYLRLDLLALLLILAVLWRAYRIWRGKLTPEPFWDALAFGGVACCAAYLYLRLRRPYYLAPVDVIAVLYLGHLLVPSWKRMPAWSKAATSLVTAAVLLQNLSLSAFRVYERENRLHAKAELADAIIARSQRESSHPQTLFFPFSSPYYIMEFASYLVYRGVDVEGYEATNAESPLGVTLVSTALAKDAPCRYYRDIVCRAGVRPKSGDLVIELPDDPESSADVKPYRDGGELLFTYEPRPQIPHSMYPLSDHVGVAGWTPLSALPDRWLESSMVLWK